MPVILNKKKGSGGGIDSLQGTANQVLVNGTSGSPQTGIIILTLPSDVIVSSSITTLTVKAPANTSLDVFGGLGAGATSGGRVNVIGGLAGDGGIGGEVIISGGSAGISSTGGNLRLRAGAVSSGTPGKVIFDMGNINLLLQTASQFLFTDSNKDITTQSAASVKTLLNLSGTNSGDVTLTGENYLSISTQAITVSPVNVSGTNITGILKAASFPALTGDVTTSSGSLATTIAAAAVSLAKMANLAANSIIGNNTGSPATPIALTTAQVKTMLNLTGTNSGDITLSGENYLSIVGQAITVGAISLSGTNVASILPNSKTTADTANGANTIVARNASGNFAAGAITMTAATVSGLSASTLVATDSAKNLTSSTTTLTPTFTGLNLNGAASGTVTLSIGLSAGALTSTVAAIAMAQAYSAGNYINFGTSGRNIGVYQSGNFFFTQNLDYNVSTPGYQYNATAAGCALELTTAGGFNLRTTPSGTGGTGATMTNRVAISNTGVVNLDNLTASSLVTTDSSKNLVSSNTLSSTVLGNVTKVTTQKFTSGSGTYTTPANVTHIKVYVYGSGGGGGGSLSSASTSSVGSGGGGGGYSELLITSPAATYSYVVGAGGAGGAAGANNGASGATTTFGTSLISVTGGAFGAYVGASLVSLIGQTAGGGQGSGGDIDLHGGLGMYGLILSATIANSGAGGTCAAGSGGGTARRVTIAGVDGAAPGGGGSGGCSINGGASQAGGDGASGLIFVEEYYVG